MPYSHSAAEAVTQSVDRILEPAASTSSQGNGLCATVAQDAVAGFSSQERSGQLDPLSTKGENGIGSTLGSPAIRIIAVDFIEALIGNGSR